MDIQQPVAAVPLGISDIAINPIGLGAWSWGDRFFWNYGQGYDDSDIHEAFQVSIDAGVNFIDTAEMYGLGKSEALLGQFIRQTDKRLIVTTKFFPLPWRLTKGQLIHALKQSLKRLQ